MSDDAFLNPNFGDGRNKALQIKPPVTLRVLPSVTENSRDSVFRVVKYWVPRLGKSATPVIDDVETFGVKSKFVDFILQMKRDPKANAFISEKVQKKVFFLVNGFLVTNEKPFKADVFELKQPIFNEMVTIRQAEPEDNFADLKSGKGLKITIKSGTGQYVQYGVTKLSKVIPVSDELFSTARTLHDFYAPIDEKYCATAIKLVETAFEQYLKDNNLGVSSSQKSRTHSENDDLRTNETVSQELLNSLNSEDEDEIPF